MFYYFFYQLSGIISPFNLVKYITFRSAMALFTSFVLSLILGKPIIKKLKKLQPDGQPIRDDGPESHLYTKKGTPTMGGVLIVLTTIFSSLLWIDLKNLYAWMILFVMFSYSIIGFLDDYKKLTKSNSKGLTARGRLALESVVALIIGIALIKIHTSYATSINIPFLKEVWIDLSYFYLIFLIFVIAGSANAVNLTDGLDGLAIFPAVMVAGCFGIISYIVGHNVFANYLNVLYIPHVGEVTVLCGALIGSGLGFLWFNAPPAMIFMGDTGSLAIGGFLGAVGAITKHEIVLAIAGGLFVIETISVILQVASFKSRRKRIFLMTPIHHHFEKKGWMEPTIVMRFWIISVLCVIVALCSLKVR